MLTAQEALVQTQSINSLRKKKKPALNSIQKQALLDQEFSTLQDAIVRAIERGKYSCPYHLDSRLEQDIISWLKLHHYSVKRYKKSFFPHHHTLTWLQASTYLAALLSLAGIPLLLLYLILGRRYGKLNIKIVWRDSRTVRIY